jgi:transglutaminase-like putative cysteine protease
MIRDFVISIFRKSTIARYVMLPVFFVVFSTLIGGIVYVFNQRPVLDTISPSIGAPGDVIVLRGKHFGERRGDNWVEIAGNRVSEGAFVNWSDTAIMMKLPQLLDDGLVYVVSRNGKSNPHMFVNRDNLPVAATLKADAGAPEIEAISATSAETGKPLVITGKNFGISRNTSEVRFTWQMDAALPQAGNPRADQMRIACTDHDFDYELWSDQEIRVRVPDGATSGNVYVTTPNGTSNPVAVEIVNQPGTRKYSDQRTYTVSLEVDISGVNASEGNMLFLRVPIPETTASQRNVSVTASNPKPYMENYKGTILHQIENLKTAKGEKIAHSVILTSYALSTAINPALVKPYSDTTTALYATYTAADQLVPAGDPEIVQKAAAIVGAEKNVYRKANLIYGWLIDNFKLVPVNKPDRPAIEAFRAGSGDDWDMAVLFCALARASGIPAIPDAGVLVDEQNNSRVHWWAEFYVESFGWVPVDPALGAGYPRQIRDDRRAWYFGNMDANHITFSRGFPDQKPMTPNSRIVYKPRFYSFQPIWEESGGNIKGYTSFWSDPIVTGVYSSGQ